MAVKKLSTDPQCSNADPPLHDWAGWVVKQFSEPTLDLFLNKLFGVQWREISISSEQNRYNPARTCQSVAKRLDLGNYTNPPWLLFLYLGQDTLTSSFNMKELSAFLSRQPELSAEDFLAQVRDEAFRRHGIDRDDPLVVLRGDVKAVMASIEPDRRSRQGSRASTASVRNSESPAPSFITRRRRRDPLDSAYSGKRPRLEEEEEPEESVGGDDEPEFGMRVDLGAGLEFPDETHDDMTELLQRSIAMDEDRARQGRIATLRALRRLGADDGTTWSFGN